VYEMSTAQKKHTSPLHVNYSLDINDVTFISSALGVDGMMGTQTTGFDFNDYDMNGSHCVLRCDLSLLN
jgi:hypothetical protein